VVRLGFAGGSVLEPGCGTGLFLAASPDHIAEASYFTGIEADTVTAKIAAQLYPESDIRHEDFTRAKLSGDYDLAIGNPPYVAAKFMLRSPFRARLCGQHVALDAT
jgi:methylase of polypeptide subunit release factors